MSVLTEIRKTVSEATPVMAVLGATDLAVAKVRRAAVELPAEVEKGIGALQAQIGVFQAEVEKAADPAALQKLVHDLPTKAAAVATDVTGRVEHRYTGLAERGKALLKQVESSTATKNLVRQGRATLSRSKAAVTTAQRSAEDVVASGEEAVTAVRRDAGDAVAGTARGASRSRAALASTSRTAKAGAKRTRGAAKGAATSARKSAAKASEAAVSAADKVGD
jgi:hypothetical protein